MHLYQGLMYHYRSHIYAKSDRTLRSDKPGVFEKQETFYNLTNSHALMLEPDATELLISL